MFGRLSLRARLIAKLVGMSLLGVTIAGVAYRLSARPAFNQFVIDRTKPNFISVVATYYQQHGSLAGITQRVGPGVDPSVPGPDVLFGLASPNGTVLLAGDGYDVGQPAPATALRAGVPVQVGGRVVAQVLPPRLPLIPTQAQLAYEGRINLALAIAAAVGLAASVLVSLVISPRILSPVGQLTAAAELMASGTVRPIPTDNRHDELSDLVAAFNAMTAALERYQQGRQYMTAEIVHELRTPLTTISGYVEAMLEGELAPTPQRLDSVSHQIRRLTNIINDLELLTMAEVGALPLNCGLIALDVLVAQSLDAHALRARERGVTLRGEVEQALPLVYADPGRIQQVIEILVSNALRHTDEGEVVVSSGSEHGSAVLKVADTGAGIEPELLPTIFDRFARGDSARRKDAQGSGLGLAIAKAIVAAHQGTIGVQSTLRKGTVFTVTLPAATASTAR